MKIFQYTIGYLEPSFYSKKLADKGEKIKLDIV